MASRSCQPIFLQPNIPRREYLTFPNSLHNFCGCLSLAGLRSHDHPQTNHYSQGGERIQGLTGQAWITCLLGIGSASGPTQPCGRGVESPTRKLGAVSRRSGRGCWAANSTEDTWRPWHMLTHARAGSSPWACALGLESRACGFPSSF